MTKLDLSGLAHFKATDLLEINPSSGKPMDVNLDLIDFDPLQPRRRLSQELLGELAASIKMKGVLEPVSLRSHPEQSGRYIVNRGERRVRASRIAGLTSIPAFVDETLDRFAQAIENLQREDLTPFDLANFIAERQLEDPALRLSDIACRLHKPRSFISEIAELVDAPSTLRQAFDTGRVRDTRTLYLLARGAREGKAAVAAILDGKDRISRELVTKALRAERDAQSNSLPTVQNPSPQQPVQPRKTLKSIDLAAPALFVTYLGRQGWLDCSRQPSPETGEVVFEDGQRTIVELAELTPVSWTTIPARHEP